MWGGADPGGKGKFGVARLQANGSFKLRCVNSGDDAEEFLKGISSLGIDAPLWWSTTATGARRVDQLLKAKYGLSSGQVQYVNSLRGAAVVQGPLLAKIMRSENPNIPITETHPKALLKALRKSGKLQDESWQSISNHFAVKGREPETEHERDALMSAIVAREAAKNVYTFNLALGRNQRELDPADTWYGPVHYWWFEDIEN